MVYREVRLHGPKLVMLEACPHPLTPRWGRVWVIDVTLVTMVSVEIS